LSIALVSATHRAALARFGSFPQRFERLFIFDVHSTSTFVLADSAQMDIGHDAAAVEQCSMRSMRFWSVVQVV
jgi:hypothetical protein